jgi:hypothetical protein
MTRDSLGYPIEDANMTPYYQQASVADLGVYLENSKGKFDAIVSDHHLKKAANYFPVNGAEFISTCYDRFIPSILVTKYEDPSILEIRGFRDKIPVVLNPEDYSAESLIKGLEKVINEFNGVMVPERKSWRTLIRIDDLNEHNVFVIIPSWNSQEVIALNGNCIPDDIRKNLLPDMRLFARVNIGTENSNELYIKNWEL